MEIACAFFFFPFSKFSQLCPTSKQQNVSEKSCNITNHIQTLTTTAATTTKHVYSVSPLSTNQYDALCLIKSLFGEAAATSRPKSRAVSSAEALGLPNEFQKEMNGEKKCERGEKKKFTVESIKRIHIHHKAFRVFFFFLGDIV